MVARIVQDAPAPAPEVVLYLVGAHVDPELRAALPGCRIVAHGDDGRTAARLSTDRPVVVCGYSAGCQGVRARLLEGAHPAAVITIDGTHASLPPHPAVLDLWRLLSAEARRGECLWVATCCLQRYVERLPTGRYAATSTLLAQALDVPELAALPASARPLPGYPGPVVLERHDGELHLLAYGSTNCDKDAHIAQQRDVLPDVLRRYVAPWLEGRAPTEPAPPPDPQPGGHVLPVVPWRDPALPLGVRCVLWSEAELARGVREIPPGSNRGPDVDRYLDPPEPVYRRATGERMRLRGQAWCSSACGAAHRACAFPGEAYPTVRVSGLEMIDDARETDTWIEAHAVAAGLEVPEVGDVCILDRSREGVSWGRHVCRIKEWRGDGTFSTIGGNEGPGEWRITERRTTDRDVLGFVMVGRRR